MITEFFFAFAMHLIWTKKFVRKENYIKLRLLIENKMLKS